MFSRRRLWVGLSWTAGLAITTRNAQSIHPWCWEQRREVEGVTTKSRKDPSTRVVDKVAHKGADHVPGVYPGVRHRLCPVRRGKLCPERRDRKVPRTTRQEGAQGVRGWLSMDVGASGVHGIWASGAWNVGAGWASGLPQGEHTGIVQWGH